MALFIVTLLVMWKGGSRIQLSLLGQYFPGYALTWRGSLLGLLYGFMVGFMWGWLVAFLRDLFLGACLYVVRLRARLSRLNDYLDRLT